jgi:hypothetical protein
MILLSEAGMILLPVKYSFTFISQEKPSDPRVFGLVQKNEARVKLLPTKDSFKLISQGDLSAPPVFDVVLKNEPKKTLPATGNDKNKRAFLKVASIAGVSIVASQLLPKKAEALIMGSSPTTGVVGVKNSSNVRINPATEETVSTLLKPSDLTFDAGSLQVKVTSLPSAGSSSFSDSGNVDKRGLVDVDRHVQVDVLSSALPSSASTETTLQTISFGGFKFTIRLATVGDVDYVGEASIGTATSAAAWRIKKIDNTSGVVITWAGTGVFNQIWDNRASLSYS